jgi:hypothetical protein
VLVALQGVMAEQHIGHTLANVSDFRQVPWEQYGYSSLQAIHKVLYLYGSSDLLYG